MLCMLVTIFPHPGIDTAAAVSELRDGAPGAPGPGRLGHDDRRRHPRLPVEVARVAEAGRGAEAPLQAAPRPRTLR